MAKSLKGFAIAMRDLAKSVEPYASEFKKTVAIEVATEIIINTPIRSGQARANWIPSVGAKASETKTGPGNSVGSISQAVAMFRGASGKAPLYLTNNLPYIGRLNNGYSLQAPANFVQRAVKTGRQRARRNLKRLYGSAK